ncbi:hypothetical protein GCM10010168_56390 [Actinoplanes ianthinogenes]|uniref:DNA-binding protein n=1 Tax=Actinoplanes ianthinogenes TaxID=122358 RepID=A0ABM7M2Z8_9ACTN|nr:hypothetical protein [Actinoplanes ianthinogenes]BCJ45941.1 hypothetical protein Aiant_65980 [Actinoplanes ianthinogenes]GGR31003.1 hypothetical protein GCM10010168_56390 [Actinoplanes ianthinogenes]
MTEALLEAGAILPGPPAGDGADAITARAYRHPALDGRTVVRLTGATVGPAEDLSMEFLGCTTAGAITVGHGRRPALGFPAWALVHAPAHGRQALALVKDMERLARTARHKPGNARDGYATLARRLGAAAPELLPTFWEQAGRAFLAADNPRMAGTCFTEARRAEQVHGLSVDEDRVRDVHVEFALAGGLPATMLTAYAREVAARRPAAEAYELVKTLSLRRITGGLPPHAGLVSDLARLARAAGLDADRETGEVVALLLAAPSTLRSHPAVWKALRPVLIRLGKRDAGLRTRLLEVLPDPPGWRTDMRDQWLELLEATGAADDLVSGDAGVPAARWLERFLGLSHYHSGRGRQAALLGLVERLAPRLIAEGGATLAPYPSLVDLDVLDVCVAAGVPVDIGATRADFGFAIDEWVADTGAGRRDLAAVVADPELRARLLLSLRHALDRAYDPLDATGLPAPVRGLVRELTGSDTAEPEHSTITDEALTTAWDGLTGWTCGGRQSSLLSQVAAVGAILADPDAAEPGLIPPVVPAWAPLLAGLGAVALRAASPATPDADRTALAVLLHLISGTPLDGGGAPVQVLEVGEEQSIDTPVRGMRDGGRLTVLFPCHGYEYEASHCWLRGAVQLAPDGVFTLPGGPGREVREAFRPSGRLGGRRLGAYLELLDERGPVPWRPEAATDLAEATGMSRAQAILLLAGLPGIDRREAAFLSAGQRTLLGLTATQAREARSGLRDLSHAQRVALLDAAMPADPAALWERGPDVAAIAAAWLAIRGRRAAVPDDLVAGLARLVGTPPAGELLRVIAAPGPGDWLTTDGLFDEDHLRAAAIALPWLAYNLTWDDPLRAALPEALRLVRERLRDPDLRVGQAWYRREHRPEAGPALLVEEDSGHVSVTLAPARLTGPDDPAIGMVGKDLAVAIRILLSGLIEHAVTTPEGAAGDPRDPRVSLPAVVDEVRQRHGLDAGAAAYYLQVLALPDPTDKAVQGWNGWKPAELRRAQQALIDAGLVVAGKRERAGRPVFLPGAWRPARAPHRPVETWKLRGLADLDGTLLVLTSLPRQFGMAWARVLDGDEPRYHLEASR